MADLLVGKGATEGRAEDAVMVVQLAVRMVPVQVILHLHHLVKVITVAVVLTLLDMVLPVAVAAPAPWAQMLLQEARMQHQVPAAPDYLVLFQELLHITQVVVGEHRKTQPPALLVG